MRRYRKILLATLLALLVLCGCGRPAAPAGGDDSETPALPPVTELNCVTDVLTLRFSREEGGAWRWTDDPSFPLDETAVQALADAMQQLSFSPITAEQLADYGLADPKQSVTLTAGGETTAYVLGEEAGDGVRYLCPQDAASPTVAPAPQELLAMLQRSIYDLALLPQLPSLTADTVKTVDLAGAQTVSLTVEDGRWLSGGADVTDRVAAFTAALGQLAFSRCVDYAPASGASAVCGLDTPAATLTVTCGSSQTLTLAIGGTYEGGRFARMEGDSTIYLLDAALADPILALAESGL